MLYNQLFLGSEIKQGDPETSLFHIIPAALECSVSYGGGTAQGADAIIRASHQLETYDQLTGEPCEKGIHTHPAIDCRGEIGSMLERLRQVSRSVASKGNIPITLGGEHTVSYGAVMGVVDAYPNERIGIVQFDAHADLREMYDDTPWSHACVMKRLVDSGLMLYQLGVRAISMEERAIRDRFPSQISFVDAIDLCRLDAQHEVTLPDNFPEKIYITVDVDALDGSIMPATGTPVAGGLGFWQLIELIRSVSKGREIVGMDVVEFAPIQGMHAYDYLCADLVYKMMGIAHATKIKA